MIFSHNGLIILKVFVPLLENIFLLLFKQINSRKQLEKQFSYISQLPLGLKCSFSVYV